MQLEIKFNLVHVLKALVSQISVRRIGEMGSLPGETHLNLSKQTAKEIEELQNLK